MLKSNSGAFHPKLNTWPWIYKFFLLFFITQLFVSYSFILGAVSPAVVVPSMLDLQIKGYGVEAGIPTLVMAASSCDDVLAISMFGVFLGVPFSEGMFSL